MRRMTRKTIWLGITVLTALAAILLTAAPAAGQTPPTDPPEDDPELFTARHRNLNYNRYDFLVSIGQGTRYYLGIKAGTLGSDFAAWEVTAVTLTNPTGSAVNHLPSTLALCRLNGNNPAGCVRSAAGVSSAGKRTYTFTGYRMASEVRYAIEYHFARSATLIYARAASGTALNAPAGWSFDHNPHRKLRGGDWNPYASNLVPHTEITGRQLKTAPKLLDTSGPALTSLPAHWDTAVNPTIKSVFGHGDRLRLEFTLDKDAKGLAGASLPIKVGEESRNALLASESLVDNPKHPSFTYEVQPGDYGRIEVDSNALAAGSSGKLTRKGGQAVESSTSGLQHSSAVFSTLVDGRRPRGPAPESLTVTSTGPYHYGEVIKFQLAMSFGGLTVPGSPQLKFELGSDIRWADYDAALSDLSVGYVVFTYTVQAADRDTDGLKLFGNLHGDSVVPRTAIVADTVWPDVNSGGGIDRRWGTIGVMGDHKADGSVGAPTPPHRVENLLITRVDTTGAVIVGGARLTWNAPENVHAEVHIAGYEYRVAGATWVNVPDSALSNSQRESTAGLPPTLPRANAFGCPCDLTITGLTLNIPHDFNIRAVGFIDTGEPVQGAARGLSTIPRKSKAPLEVRDLRWRTTNEKPTDNLTAVVVGWNPPLSYGFSPIVMYEWELSRVGSGALPTGQAASGHTTETSIRLELEPGVKYTVTAWAENGVAIADRVGVKRSILVVPVVDSRAPTDSARIVDGDELVIVYNENLFPGELPVGNFTVSVTSSSTTADAVVQAARAQGRRVILTLGAPVGRTDTVRMSYSVTSGAQIEDLANNPAAAISSRAVVNVTCSSGTCTPRRNSDVTPPVLIEAGGSSGAAIVLAFDEDLDTSSVPPSYAFHVWSSIQTRHHVQSVAVCGRQVQLNLLEDPGAGAVWVDYIQHSNVIRDRSSNKNPVEPFFGHQVMDAPDIALCSSLFPRTVALSSPAVNVTALSTKSLEVEVRSVPHARSYRVQWKKKSENSYPTGNARIVDQTNSLVLIEVSGLTPATEYSIRVRAENDNAQSAWVETSSVTGNELYPLVMTISYVSTRSASMAFTKQDKATGYELRWKVKSSREFLSGDSLTATETPVTITGLVYSTNYLVQGRALRNGTVYPVWTEVEFSTLATELATPAFLSISPGDDIAHSVIITAGYLSSVDYYSFQIRKGSTSYAHPTMVEGCGPGPDDDRDLEAGECLSTIEITGLAADTEYDIRARGEAKRGEGADEETITGGWFISSFETMPIPASPDVRFKNITASSATAYIIKTVASASGYEIQWGRRGGDPFDSSATFQKEEPYWEASLTGLVANSEYEARVRAVINGEYTEWHSTEFATPQLATCEAFSGFGVTMSPPYPAPGHGTKDEAQSAALGQDVYIINRLEVLMEWSPPTGGTPTDYYVSYNPSLVSTCPGEEHYTSCQFELGSPSTSAWLFLDPIKPNPGRNDLKFPGFDKHYQVEVSPVCNGVQGLGAYASLQYEAPGGNSTRADSDATPSEDTLLTTDVLGNDMNDDDE